MSEIRKIQGALQGAGRRFAVVSARFNGRISERLAAGAVDCLERHGVAATDIVVVHVPGAWEIPQALDELAAGVKGIVEGTSAVSRRGIQEFFDGNLKIDRIVDQYEDLFASVLKNGKTA